MGPDRRSNEDIWADRAEKAGNAFTRHPIGWTVGIIITLLIVGTIWSFVGGWFNAGKEIFEPKNVKEQYAKVIEDYVAMERQAEIACSATNAAESGDSRQGPTFLEDPALAYENKYREIEVDYDQRQHNLFKAELVGPKGYPHTAPTLEEMQSKLLAEGKGGC